MKVTRVLAVMLMLLLAVGLMVGCGSSTTTTTAPATGDTTATTDATGDTTADHRRGAPVTLKIGAAGPFTGDLAKIGTDALQAIRWPWTTTTPRGKGGNITFAVEVGDDAADPAKAATGRPEVRRGRRPSSGSSAR